jgi:hypothetical protein
MTQNLVSLVSSVNDAQRRVRDSTRQTPEWRDAQRAAVEARLDYWNAMCLTWDVRHSKSAAAAEPPVNGRSRAAVASRDRRRRRWFPAPLLARSTADEAPARRGPQWPAPIVGRSRLSNLI